MSLQSILVVLVLGLTLGGQVQTGEIVGGHEAVPHSRPYMVLLKRDMGHGATSYCDGFLVSDKFVMTAAHCQARIYYVHVGLHHFLNNESPEGIKVCREIPYEGYNAEKKRNDIMLLELCNKVQITEQVRAIKLASQRDLLPQRCIVSGWGYSESKQDMASELREVNVTLKEDPNNYCAEHHLYCSWGEQGPSSGDSGGPLVCEDELAFGVVSFSTNKAPIIKVYGRLPDYLDWIKRHVNNVSIN